MAKHMILFQIFLSYCIFMNLGIRNSKVQIAWTWLLFFTKLVPFRFTMQVTYSGAPLLQEINDFNQIITTIQIVNICISVKSGITIEHN